MKNDDAQNVTEEADGQMASAGDASPWQALLDHLSRCFEAEEENARRHNDTTKTLVTAIVAFLAVGLFRFGLSLSPGSLPVPLWMRVSVTILLIGGIWCLVWSSTYLLFRVRTDRRTARLIQVRETKTIGAASLHMFPDPQDIQELDEPTPGTADYVVFKASGQTLAAAATLARRNSTRETEIFLGRRWFGLGVGAISFAVMLYVITWWYPSG